MSQPPRRAPRRLRVPFDSLLPTLLLLPLGLTVSSMSGGPGTPPEPSPATTTSLGIDGPRAVPVGGRIELRAVGVAPGATCHWSLDPVPGSPPGPASGRTRLVNPAVRTYANGTSLTLYGREVSGRAGDVRVRLTCTQGGQELRASARVSVVDGGLTAFRPQHGAGYFPFPRTAVGDADEADPQLGPGIRRSDQADVDPNGEDDLIELRVQVQPAGASFVLARQDTSLELWTTRTRGAPVTFNGLVSEPLVTSAGGEATVWVEWTAAQHGVSSLRLQPESGSANLDRVTFHSFQSIVFALGGEDQSPTVPVSSNNGTFVVGIDLYRLGYDVHQFDEDNVSSSGAGAVYNEAVTAIQDRAATQVISFGYSHGGGSTYDLVERLDNNRASLGSFQIPFTSYVDGIENDSDFDVQQENRFPPSSAYHANHYQRGSLEDFFLDGGPVPGAVPPPSGLDVETTPWGAGANHFVVDDFIQVRDFIEINLDQRVTR